MHDAEQPRVTKQLINELSVKFANPVKEDLFGVDILTGGKTLALNPADIPFIESPG